MSDRCCKMQKHLAMTLHHNLQNAGRPTELDLHVATLKYKVCPGHVRSDGKSTSDHQTMVVDPSWRQHM